MSMFDEHAKDIKELYLLGESWVKICSKLDLPERSSIALYAAKHDWYKGKPSMYWRDHALIKQRYTSGHKIVSILRDLGYGHLEGFNKYLKDNFGHIRRPSWYCKCGLVAFTDDSPKFIPKRNICKACETAYRKAKNGSVGNFRIEQYDLKRDEIIRLYKGGYPISRIHNHLKLGSQNSLRRYIKNIFGSKKFPRNAEVTESISKKLRSCFRKPQRSIYDSDRELILKLYNQGKTVTDISNILRYGYPQNLSPFIRKHSSLTPYRECKCGTKAYVRDDLDLFPIDAASKYGLRNTCKKCINKSNNEISRRPESKAKKAEYRQRPEVKAKKAEYNKRYKESRQITPSDYQPEQPTITKLKIKRI